jgi:arylsulfatase A-like enzyme
VGSTTSPARPRLRGALLACVLPLLAAGFLLGSGCGDEPARPPAATATYTQDGALVAPGPPPAHRPNVIVILLDTLRRDAVAYPGESGGSMPYLSALAADSVGFSNATSPSPWTVPAITTMLTGLHVREHRCDYPLGIPRLAPAITTYAEALSKAYGYDTLAFSGGPWFRTAKQSILQGFEGGSVEKGWNLQGTRPEVGAWAKTRDKSKPFFLFLHAFEAHDPYGAEDHPYPDVRARWNELGFRERVARFDLQGATEPWQWAQAFLVDRAGRDALSAAHGAEYHKTVTSYTWRGFREDPRPELAASLRAAYLEGVRWLDDVLRDSIAALEEYGLLEDTLLVITSDHGESFGEHGMLGHGRQLYDELIRIPLILKGPGPFAGPKQIAESVSLADVMPTLFDWAGFAQLPGAHGRSLLPVMRGEAPGHPVISEERLGRENTAEDTRGMLFSVRDGRRKLLIEYDIGAGRMTESLFDLRADPGEQHNGIEAWRASGSPGGPAFCRAVETIRDWAWSEVEDRRALEGTIYGGDDAKKLGPRPAPCAPASR